MEVAERPATCRACTHKKFEYRYVEMGKARVMHSEAFCHNTRDLFEEPKLIHDIHGRPPSWCPRNK